MSEPGPTLADLTARGMEVAALYDELNLAQRGRVWTRAETMMGFVGDVGDLAKLVMAAEGARSDVGGRGTGRRTTGERGPRARAGGLPVGGAGAGQAVRGRPGRGVLHGDGRPGGPAHPLSASTRDSCR